MTRLAVLVAAAVALLAAAPAQARPAPGLCKLTKARGAVPDTFALDACFDGKTLQLRDQLDVPVNLRLIGDYGRITRTETDVSAGAAVTRVARPDSRRLLPGDILHIAVGPKPMTVNVVPSPSADFYFLARAVAKFWPHPVARAYDTFAGLIEELSQAFLTLKGCAASGNLFHQVGCRAVFVRDVGFAFGRPVVGALLGGGLKAAYALITSTKTISDWLLKGFDGALALQQSEPYRITGAGGTAGAPLPAAGAGQEPVMMVVDVSGSMADSIGGVVKIDGAKQALLDYLKTVTPGTPLGLRTYPAVECDAGDVRFEVAPRDTTEMAAEIRTLQPDGGTPTAFALRAAVKDLQAAGYARGTIVLVSDGEANCDAPPCPAARAIARSGFALQTITVGFHISRKGASELRCIAEATDGVFVHPEDSDELEDALDAAARPKLEVTLDHPAEVAAEAGSDRSGLARIKARIASTGSRQAEDVTARLRFDGLAPGVDRPVRALGNIDPHDARTVVWSFRPSLQLVGRSVDFTIIARARNGRDDGSASGSVRVVDRSSPAAAGPILKGKGRLAILGDSFSAGEGADTYLPGTDTARVKCHRSARTYLVEAAELGIPTDHVLACSGAVTNDVTAPNGGNHVASQVDQLERLMERSKEPVSGVVMTMGGNDAGFGTVAMSCLYLGNTCADEIYPHLLPAGSVPTADYLAQRTGRLQTHLVGAYAAINAVLNSKRALERRGGAAPIIVLSYPMPLPGSKRSCPSLVTVEPDEIAFVQRFQANLNAIVDKAVIEARNGYLKVPVFYVANTEDAFAPNHTACDQAPYARGLETFTANQVDWAKVVRDGIRAAGYPFGLRIAGLSASEAWDVFNRTKQELLHPNQAGYHAMTQAIVRWSQTDAADAAQAFVRGAGAAVTSPPSWRTDATDLGQLDGKAIELQGGTSYRLTAGGFAPNSPVEIAVHSEVRPLELAQADGAGDVATRIGIPRDIRAGAHAVELVGADARGRPRRVAIPVRVDPGSALPPRVELARDAALVLYAGAALLWAAVLVLRRRERLRG